MKTRALVVGVDAYPESPLTSAVNDAVALRQALLELDLVAADDITLLTSPPAAGATDEATYSAITAILEGLYRDGDDVDRFYFYFAGHGLLAFSDPAGMQSGTALLPVDVLDVERNARNLIHVTELLGYLRLAGPQEQLFFLDACRDLPYRRQPAFASLAWGSRAPGAARRQAVLYAVAELGQSQSTPGGHGAMTRRLIEALHGTGSAVDWDLRTDTYVVTMESVGTYVKTKVAEDLGADADTRFALPSLDRQDPPPSAIREVDAPPPRPLVVRIVPAEAAPTTTVKLGLGRSSIVQSWPPSKYHEPVLLDPQRYRLTAVSSNGRADPSSCMVDVREQSEATVTIRADDGDDANAVLERQLGTESTKHVRGSEPDAEVAAPTHLVVQAGDRVVAIDVTGLQPPYSTLSAFGGIGADVAPGAYRVDFRFGPETVATRQVYIGADEEVLVRAPAQGVRPVGWPLLALEWFSDREVERPVVVMVESGDTRVEIAGQPVALAPIDTPDGQAAIGFGVGIERPFDVTLRAGDHDEVAVASACLRDRVTVLTRRRTQDGALDLSQNLFPHPGRPRLPYDPTPAQAELAKLLQTGQQLFKSGELLRARNVREVRDLLTGKWTDPVLGCMGIYAAEADPQTTELEYVLEQTAHNLLRFFADLPDARIAASMRMPARRRELLLPLLNVDAAPLLRRSAGRLAAFATEIGASEHPAIDRYARIPANQPWTLERL